MFERRVLEEVKEADSNALPVIYSEGSLMISDNSHNLVSSSHPD
jgi:hypothetical protein